MLLISEAKTKPNDLSQNLQWIDEKHSIPVRDGHVIQCQLRYHPQYKNETPIVCCNGLGVSTVFWTFVQEQLSQQRPVLVWDYRGHGRTEIPKNMNTLTIEQACRDLTDIVNHLEFETFILFGHSMGAQVILEYSLQFPERVRLSVSILGTYGRPIHTFCDSPILALILFRLAYAMTMTKPKVINLLKGLIAKNRSLRQGMVKALKLLRLVDSQRMPDGLLDEYLKHLGLLDVRILMSLAKDMAFHSVESALATIQTPTLVVAGTDDSITPLWLSEELADRLPNAELFVLQGGSHAALVEQPETLNRRIQEFLAQNSL